MASSFAFRICTVLMPALFLCGCVGLSPFARPARIQQADGSERTLSSVVAELHLHLKDDTYRHDRARTEGGQNVFALALWRLDRVRALRGRSAEAWENLDVVIEYARARALERLRRYPEARDAYARVASRGTRLADAAEEGFRVMSLFARSSGPPEQTPVSPDEVLQLIEERVRAWERLAFEYGGSPFEPLAREEAEAWEMMRVDWFARHRSVEEAIGACRRLLERHHGSKLHANHLIRIGNLHAAAAQGLVLRARAKLALFDAERYEAFLDQAFAAYELAGEHPVGSAGDEARSKIESLLAEHEGIRAHVP
jgi:tetratricopeptide (TPR) repeat protein